MLISLSLYPGARFAPYWDGTLTTDTVTVNIESRWGRALATEQDPMDERARGDVTIMERREVRAGRRLAVALGVFMMDTASCAHTSAPQSEEPDPPQAASTARLHTEPLAIDDEPVSEPWAGNMERAVAPLLTGVLRTSRVKCYAYHCVLVVESSPGWPAIEEALASVWNYYFGLHGESGSAFLVKLHRHPADRSGTNRDGMPSAGLGPDDSCLAGYACDTPLPAPTVPVRLKEGTLCFTDDGVACACASERGQAEKCPAYEY